MVLEMTKVCDGSAVSKEVEQLVNDAPRVLSVYLINVLEVIIIRSLHKRM
jgi:hypothetical protein